MDLTGLSQKMAVLFFCIAVGFLAAKARVMDVQSNKKLSSLVVNVANPMQILASALTGEHVLSNRQTLGLTGISVTVATACSSSAKVFAQAERLIRTGMADAAIVGGVDSLCGSVLFGFNSLELVSSEQCRPFDVERRGINLGEAAGFALLEKQAVRGPWLLGYGESNDAHHMSTPHPEGLGARMALAVRTQLGTPELRLDLPAPPKITLPSR